MNKRIVCVLLTLIMLMSLVPMSASAAGMSTSEAAITILKQMEGYSVNCDKNGYTGYGTKCTAKGTHGAGIHEITEKTADVALREHLKTLDEAINSFASRKGVALNQGQHDALVLFSFENGTAWTTGTGDLQAAVAAGKTGSEFLNAICWWDTSDADDLRRMIEANMYLNGVYSSAKPSQFICVEFDANGGTLPEAKYQYFDVTTAQPLDLIPTNSYYSFMGWYTQRESGRRVTSVNSSSIKKVYAHWQAFADEPGASEVNYKMQAKDLASDIVYTAPNGIQTRTIATGYIKINSEFLDDNNNRWGRIVDDTDGTVFGWVLLKDVSGVNKANQNTVEIDVTVTVTNSYVRSRVNADIQSAQNGTYNQGDKLRIINTADADGFLWGQVAKSAEDNTPIGWVALIYTNWESVRNQTTTSNTVSIATATITFNGYVNVRSDAGTANKIVGALSKGTTVALYETKYINGIQWGRCNTGWFCLAYADVQNLTEGKDVITDAGFSSYAFYGVLTNPGISLIYEQPSESAEVVRIRDVLNTSVTITNLVSNEGYTWGKFEKGWVKVTDNTTYEAVDVNLYEAKYFVAADSLSVRTAPNTSASRIDTLVKGVEFNVNRDAKNQVLVVGDTIWGFADKVGEDEKTYSGWVNLANKNVTRNGAPDLSGSSDSSTPSTGLMATVINTDNLKVRNTGATYGTQIGTLSRGDTVAVWEANEDKSWYKVDSNKNGTYDYEGDGWVSGAYLNVYEATSDGGSTGGSSGGSSTGTAVETGMGVVANTYSGVNVRQGAGASYAIVGKLLPGTAVEILEVTTVGAGKWGRTAQGWVSMDYIAMVSNYPITGTTGSTGTGSNTTVTDTEPAIFTGVVNMKATSEGVVEGKLVVFKEASLKSEKVRSLADGDPITLHQLLEVVVEEPSSGTATNEGVTSTVTKKTTYWARVNDGYIFAPGDNISLDTLDEHTYTVTESDKLNVRDTAAGNIKYALSKGDQVTVTKLQIVNNNVWGYVEADSVRNVTKDELGNETVTTWDGYGWVSLAYMTKGAITIQNNTQSGTTTPTPGTGTGTGTNVGMGNGSNTGGFVTNTSGYRYTGTVIRSNEVNVRATASTSASITTTLKKGAALVIYETMTSENMAWGRCDAGWIYLYYVDLVPVTGAVDARVVYNDNTIIYTDMNGSGVAGTYAKMSVIDIYEIVGKMARTDLGWVNTDNLL